MEKSKNRLEYLAEFKAICDSIVLTDKFIHDLKSHQYFQRYSKPIEDLNGNKSMQKAFILSELTRERYPCNVFIELLRKHHQDHATQRLTHFNTSKGPIDLSYDIHMEVAVALTPKVGLSNAYLLMKKPRGKLVIINNVEEPQSLSVEERGQPTIHPLGLKNETLRFKDLFEQLYFEVEVLTKKSAKQMKEELTRISREKGIDKYEAFVQIVISHGEDEAVLGYNACEKLREIRFGEISKEKDKEVFDKAMQTVKSDQVNIKDLTQIFSGQNCPKLSTKPKLHFIICCRVNSEDSTALASGDSLNGGSVKQNKIDPAHITGPDCGKGQNLDTFVSYACAKGFPTFFDENRGMSLFGQAFSHSLAQYACDEPLTGIMNRTVQRLNTMYSKREESSQQLGSYAIEVNTYAMSRSLYFNPGFFDTEFPFY